MYLCRSGLSELPILNFAEEKGREDDVKKRLFNGKKSRVDQIRTEQSRECVYVKQRE